MKKGELQREYLASAKAFAARFKQDSNIIGITFNGGVSRGTGDEYSDIDLDFYVKNKHAKNLPPAKDITINCVWFDIDIIDFEKKKNAPWSMVDKWGCSQCKILFDPHGKIKAMIKQKARFEQGEREKLLQNALFKAGWCILLAETFLARKELKHAHLLVNESLDAFVDYYFLKAKHFIPYYKWKYYYFERFTKVSKHVKATIFDNYKIKNYSEKELLGRIKSIKREIIENDLKEEYMRAHIQDLEKVKGFRSSLRKGVRYGKPW